MKKSFMILGILALFILTVAWIPPSNLWHLQDGVLTAINGRTASISSLPYKDEDSMSSNSDAHVPTQQSVKAYVDALVPSGTKVTVKSTATTYTIGTTSANELYNGLIIVTGATTITIPAVASYDGMNFVVMVVGAYAVNLDANAVDRMILDGTALDDGDKATSPGTTGAAIACVKDSSAGVICTSGSNNGTLWTDGGA